MSSLIAQTEDYHPITFEINLPNKHLLESFSHFTSVKMEMFLHANPEDVKAILKGYEEDLHFTNIIHSFPIKPPFNFKNYHQNEDGLIFFGDQSGKDCLCISSSMWHNLMEEIHGSLTGAVHVGFEQTYGCIANGSFWPEKTRGIHKFLYTCPICQKIKHTHHLPYGLLQLIPIPMQWFKVITMDFIGELPKSQGFNFIFILICKLTKYAFSIPCTTNPTERKATQMIFAKSVTYVSLLRQIIANHDTQWRNLFWKKVCKAMGSSHTRTTAYHTQANGQTEILNQTIEVTIPAFININHNNWLPLLLYLASAYNSTPHTTTKFPPLLPTYSMGSIHTLLSISSWKNLQLDVLTNTTSMRPVLSSFLRLFPLSGLLPKNALKLAQLWFKDSYNKNHIHVPYKPSNKVLINISLNYWNQRALALSSLEGTMAHLRLPNALVQSLIKFGFPIPMAFILCSASCIPNDSGPTLIKNGWTYNPFEKIQKNMKLKKSWSSERNTIAKDTGLCTNANGKIKGLPTNGYWSLIFGMQRKLLTHGNSSRKSWTSWITLSNFWLIKIAEKAMKRQNRAIFHWIPWYSIQFSSLLPSCLRKHPPWNSFLHSPTNSLSIIIPPLANATGCTVSRSVWDGKLHIFFPLFTHLSGLANQLLEDRHIWIPHLITSQPPRTPTIRPLNNAATPLNSYSMVYPAVMDQIPHPWGLWRRRYFTSYKSLRGVRSPYTLLKPDQPSKLW